MCEVLNADGTPHESNGRATIDDDDDDFWFGFEQEYTLIDLETELPLGFPKGGYPGPQGPYYTSVGARNTKGRELVDEHLHLCLEAGLERRRYQRRGHAMGQWEYQIFRQGCRKVLVTRFGLPATFSSVRPKLTTSPSICIPNQSRATGMDPECTLTFQTEPCVTKEARNSSRKSARSSARTFNRHISVYGSDNNQRLTGFTKLSPLTNSVTAFPTAEPPFVFQSERSKMVGKVDWKTADLHPMATLTQLQRQLSRPPKKHLLRNFLVFLFKRRWSNPSPFFIFSSS